MKVPAAMLTIATIRGSLAIGRPPLRASRAARNLRRVQATGREEDELPSGREIPVDREDRIGRRVMPGQDRPRSVQCYGTVTKITNRTRRWRDGAGPSLEAEGSADRAGRPMSL